MQGRFFGQLLGAFLLALAGCSGSCGGCAGLTPLPQPFDDNARVDRGVQVRLSRSGLDFIQTRFGELATSFLEPACGSPGDVPCAAGFGSVCDSVRSTCVDGAGASVPILGFEVEFAVSGDATVCRDNPNDPGRRQCYAWIYLEDLALTPSPPSETLAVVTARIKTSAIPIRYARGILDLDCLVTVDSTAAGSPTQDLEMQLALSEYGPDRRLRVDVASVSAMVPDEDLTIVEDPIAGTGGDVLACRGLNAIGFLKQVVLDQITDSLGGLVADELDKALGATCFVPANCPTGTTCSVEGYCEDASNRIIPAKLGLDGRLDPAALLGSLGAGAVGNLDVAFGVGGSSSTDPTGVVVSSLVGVEHTGPLADCALDTVSPRLRPGFSVPSPMPSEDTVDLDGDGTPETPFMVALGLTQAVVEQAVWSVYRTGTLCFGLDSTQVSQLNTGALALVLPSLAQLTRRDTHPEAVFPVRVVLRPSREPTVRIGTGHSTGDPASPRLEDALIEIAFDDIQLELFAFIEERFVRVATVWMDLGLGLGLYADPAGDIKFSIADLGMAIADVRVENSEILAESPEELEAALPTLITLALPQLTDQLPAFSLPGAADLAGFELDVVGARGVFDGPTLLPIAGIFANLTFSPLPAANLRQATSTEIVSVDRDGDTVSLQLAASADDAEFQLRFDRGIWSSFTQSSELRLTLPRWRTQGDHAIEVRARSVGSSKTLDPTPARAVLRVDDIPPIASAVWEAEAIRVKAYDFISQDRLRYRLLNEFAERDVRVVDGAIVVPPEFSDSAALWLWIADEADNATTVFVERADPITMMGCRCLGGSSMGWPGVSLLALAFVHGVRRRKRRATAS